MASSIRKDVMPASICEFLITFPSFKISIRLSTIQQDEIPHFYEKQTGQVPSFRIQTFAIRWKCVKKVAFWQIKKGKRLYITINSAVRWLWRKKAKNRWTISERNWIFTPAKVSRYGWTECPVHQKKSKKHIKLRKMSPICGIMWEIPAVVSPAWNLTP